MKIKIVNIFLFLYIVTFNVKAQNKTIDSLKLALNQAEESMNKERIIYSSNQIGYYYEDKMETLKALEYFKKSLTTAEEIKNKEEIARATVYIGMTYHNLGDKVKALEYYTRSLKISREIKNKEFITFTLNCIAEIYTYSGDTKTALEYMQEILKINQLAKDTSGIAYAYNNIGAIYDENNEKDQALKYYEKSLELFEQKKEKDGNAKVLNNIGVIYSDLGKFQKSIEFAHKALIIYEEINDQEGICNSTGSLAHIYLRKGMLKESEYYGKRSIEISKKLGFPRKIELAASTLSKIYKKQNKYKDALVMYELEIKMRDSVKTGEAKEAIIKNNLQLQYQNKLAADSIKNAGEQKIKNAQLIAQKAQLKNEKNQRFALYGGLALVLIFTGFIFNRFKLTQKQKAIIEIKEQETQAQKHIIEEKHKEISDSINYAERIQRALLASKKMLDKNLNNYFILFKPKDVVSGDFYWATKLQNKNFAIVTADSTGHGVPGAIMSIVNIASLDKAVTRGITSPDLILNETRSLVIENLKNDGSEEGGKDGMDASLLSFDFNNNLLQCAAANNPIWIIRNNELIEIKADRMPIGKHDRDSTPFTLHTITLQKGDTIYTLTDGFPDQFGGEGGKKFKSKQLQTILLSIANEPMEIQKQKLSDAFDNWKGKLEQVDDVTVIGIRI